MSGLTTYNMVMKLRRRSAFTLIPADILFSLLPLSLLFYRQHLCVVGDVILDMEVQQRLKVFYIKWLLSACSVLEIMNENIYT